MKLLLARRIEIFMIENVLSIVIITILGLWVVTDIILSKREKRLFIICFALITGIVIAEICCSLYDNSVTANKNINVLFNVIGFTLSPFVFAFESFVYDRSHPVARFIPAIINAPIVLLSPYTGWIFFVNQNNDYSRGPLFWVFILTFAFSIILALIAKFKIVHFTHGYFRLRIFVGCVVMLVGMSFQVIFPQYHSTWIIICVFFILDYAIVCEINSMIDGVTGLLNKTVFNNQISHLHIDENDNYYIIMMDINDFKTVNDTKGHLYGDKCLREIASILENVFKRNGNVFRFGGDEFCVLINAKSDLAFKQLIDNLHREILLCREKNDNLPGLAIGFSKFRPGSSIHEIIDDADFNMYNTKKMMKDKVDSDVFIL